MSLTHHRLTASILLRLLICAVSGSRKSRTLVAAAADVDFGLCLIFMPHHSQNGSSCMAAFESFLANHQCGHELPLFLPMQTVMGLGGENSLMGSRGLWSWPDFLRPALSLVAS